LVLFRRFLRVFLRACMVLLLLYAMPLGFFQGFFYCSTNDQSMKNPIIFQIYSLIIFNLIGGMKT